MATNKRNQSNKKVAGVSYEFEGRHMESEQIVRGEVPEKLKNKVIYRCEGNPDRKKYQIDKRMSNL